MILFAAFLVIALSAVICVLAATAGDGRAAKEMDRLRKQTPYTSKPRPVDDRSRAERWRTW